MREIVSAPRILDFMRRLGEAAAEETRVYLTGGATAVLLGWRESTIDIDLKIIPETDALFRAIPALKESLHVNIELASPDLFIPALPDWQKRSLFISREGRISWHHYDPYSQALAKIERGHDRDRIDVRAFFRLGLVQPEKLRQFFQQIVPQLIRYPSIDPPAFARKVEKVLSQPLG